MRKCFSEYVGEVVFGFDIVWFEMMFFDMLANGVVFHINLFDACMKG